MLNNYVRNCDLDIFVVNKVKRAVTQHFGISTKTNIRFSKRKLQQFQTNIPTKIQNKI